VENDLRLGVILLAFFLPFTLQAQQKAIPVNVSVFNESTAIPFTRAFTEPIHPGIQLGTEFNYSAKAHSRWFQTANVSYFYHNYLAQGIGLSTEIGYEYRLNFGLAIQGLLGVGYMHTFATGSEFSLSGGQYEEKPDRGNARFTPSLSFDMAYYLVKDDKSSPKIFIRYQAWAEYPYSPGFIPVMTHLNLHVGAGFSIHSRKGSHE
jgi:hypothetical protein